MQAWTRRKIQVGTQTVIGALCSICPDHMQTVIYPESALEEHEKHHTLVKPKRSSNNPSGRPPGNKKITYKENIKIR